MSRPTDVELMHRFREGDGEALGLLFERHANVLAARIRRRLPAHVCRKISVSDILQETRIVAYQRREDFEDRRDGAFRAWLLGIADLKAKAAVQKYAGTAKRASGREVSRGLRPETEQFVGNAPSPSQAAIANEFKELARRAMASLPTDYREVLHLVREEQLTLREVALRMGRSRDAVKKLYGRALLRFTDIFSRLRGDQNA